MSVVPPILVHLSCKSLYISFLHRLGESGIVHFLRRLQLTQSFYSFYRVVVCGGIYLMSTLFRSRLFVSGVAYILVSWHIFVARRACCNGGASGFARVDLVW